MKILNNSKLQKQLFFIFVNYIFLPQTKLRHSLFQGAKKWHQIICWINPNKIIFRKANAFNKSQNNPKSIFFNPEKFRMKNAGVQIVKYHFLRLAIIIPHFSSHIQWNVQLQSDRACPLINRIYRQAKTQNPLEMRLSLKPHQTRP